MTEAVPGIAAEQRGIQIEKEIKVFVGAGTSGIAWLCAGHVDAGAGYMVEHSKEAMTWYQCRAEVRRLDKEMRRGLTGSERPVVSVRCHFGSGE